MKHLKQLTRCCLVTSVFLVIGACADDEEKDYAFQDDSASEVRNTIKMELVGGIASYDQQVSQIKEHAYDVECLLERDFDLSGFNKYAKLVSADNNNTQNQSTPTYSTSWSNGSKVYISFNVDSCIITGIATYNSENGWSLDCDGTLSTGSDLKCEARYFVNAKSSNSGLVSINSNTSIYEDVNAKYTYENGSLIVQAIMSPKTGRIRFNGNSGETIYLTGISYYTFYTPETNTFISSNAMITTTVNSNGRTPYVYGEFTDTDRYIGLINPSSGVAFTRTCADEILKPGASGYMNVPTESAHNRWRSGLYLKYNNVEFKMIPVAGYSGGFFLIGETEVTRGMYYGASDKNKNKPITGCYSSPFIEKIKSSLGLPFGIPTGAQWTYAAQGGNKSHGYTYSGSNNINEVAWYSGNSGNEIHDVKTKAPNELGIYDMSGNAGEYTMNGNYGGSAFYDASYCSVTSHISDIDGFRLILTIPSQTSN